MRGFPAHLDLVARDIHASIGFYQPLLSALGFSRERHHGAAWEGARPTRATWSLRVFDAVTFEIDLRPVAPEDADPGRCPYPLGAPRPHHLALHADSDPLVDDIYYIMRRAKAQIADAPAHYGGRPGYGKHYYAVFFLDPDEFKVEVVHIGV